MIFRYDLGTSQYTVLHQFQGGAGDGATPDHGGLTIQGSRLYGLTTKGAAPTTACSSGSTLPARTSRSCTRSPRAARMARSPQGSLLLQGSTLYGMTTVGRTG